ncbi:MAG: transcription termination factor NusA [Nitrospirota bacterium]
MSKELSYVIEQISREKGIAKETLIEALRSALLSAAKKKFKERSNIDLMIDPKTCEVSVFETKRIVTMVSNKNEEISVEDAKKFFSDKIEGDIVKIPLDLHDFSRIAAQAAKQIVFQKVREAERDVIYSEFKDKIGQIMSGTVMRKEKGAYFLNIGKTEAILPIKETLPNETLKRGDIVRAYIEDVKITPRGPAIFLTRTTPDFIAALFKMEVPEINDGLVVIKHVVREPGERTKLAVYSQSSSVDPVGACVGMKGTRVQSIVRELRGERIDIIPWTDDLRELIARALSPATVDRIGINEEDKTAMVIVNDQQLSIAIGKKGQNVRLAMKLTGWEIDILSESEYSKLKMEEADKTFEDSIKKEADKQDIPSIDG